jgi:hypothetical protein
LPYLSQPAVFPVDSSSSPSSDSPPVDPTGAEARFLERLRQARDTYVQTVQDALRELGGAPPPADVTGPPALETMSNSEMADELAGFGFRFTTREAAVSKLVRCWAARSGRAAAAREQDPIDFIRTRSKYYEQIITYVAIPLASLWHEMSDAGIRISVHRLRSLLDEEGVAFLDEKAASK